MCDTWVAMKDATLEGRVIFAKNSDRPIFDCQPLLLQPRKHWPAGSRIQTGICRTCRRQKKPLPTWVRALIGAGGMKKG